MLHEKPEKVSKGVNVGRFYKPFVRRLQPKKLVIRSCCPRIFGLVLEDNLAAVRARVLPDIRRFSASQENLRLAIVIATADPH